MVREVMLQSIRGGGEPVDRLTRDLVCAERRVIRAG